MSYETRENKLIEIIKKNYILIGIIILALIIRLYYFFITNGQTLWWDELSYADLAKNFVTHQWDANRFIMGELTIRPVFMSLIWSVLMRMEFTEAMSKFVLEIVPSFFIVIFVYFIAKRMYNVRVALISSFLFATSWISIFYSMRFMTHIPGLLASFASILLFFKAIESEKISFKYLSASVFLFFIAVLFRWNYGIVGFAYVLLILFTYKLSFIKQKAFWFGVIVGSIPILIFFGINLVTYHSLFPALSFVSSHAATSVKPIAFYTLGFIPHILQIPFLILFIIGLIITVVQLILGWDSISQVKKLKSNLFIVVILLLNLAFLIFYIKYAEDRYLFECLMSMIFMVAIPLDIAYNYLQKYNKIIAVIVIVVILGAGTYLQYTYGDNMIMSKKDSYAQMKETFLWFKDNVPANSVLIGSGIEPYTIYYSGLTPIEYYPYMNDSILNQSLKVDYFVFHAFTPQDEDYRKFLESNQKNMTIVYVSFAEKEKKNPVVIVSQFNH